MIGSLELWDGVPLIPAQDYAGFELWDGSPLTFYIQEAAATGAAQAENLATKIVLVLL